MTDLETLRQNILNVVKDDNFNVNDLIQLLGPVSLCTEDPLFMENINDIVTVLTKDRNGDNKFTIDDLRMLSTDIIGITTLVTSILLVVNAIPELKLQYKPGDTEELIFKLLAYILLVIVPQKTGHPWTYEEKCSVLDLTLLIYKMIMSTQLAQNVMNNIESTFQSKGWCSCFTSQDQQKVNALSKSLPNAKLNLAHAMNNIRDKSVMIHDIKKLKKTVNKKKH